jgi:methanesulfonate monooxygenase large subunit
LSSNGFPRVGGGDVSAIEGERLVHNSVYSDERLFRREQRTLHSRVWQFVCHDSDLADEGDYLTTTVAGNPVVVTRGKDGAIRGMYNVCRHRGAQVMEGSGNCQVMRCPYHWWVYELDGGLRGLPGSPAYEGTGFTKENFGLVPIRTESLFGLHFVCADADAPSLIDFLGPDIVETLGKPLADTPVEVIHTQSWDVPINWKLVAENQRDGYHVPFVHPIFRSASPASKYQLSANGHAVQATKLDYERMPEELKGATEYALPGFEGGGGYIMTLFPDLICQVRNNYFMLSSSVPKSVDLTVVTRRIFGVVGDDDERRKVRMLSADATSLSSYEHEDMPVLMRQRAGLDNWAVPYSLIARGANATEGTRGDDNRLRQWWQYWRNYVGVDTNRSPYAEEWEA